MAEMNRQYIEELACRIADELACKLAGVIGENISISRPQICGSHFGECGEYACKKGFTCTAEKFNCSGTFKDSPAYGEL